MFYTREKPILNGVGMNIFINYTIIKKNYRFFLFTIEDSSHTG